MYSEPGKNQEVLKRIMIKNKKTREEPLKMFRSNTYKFKYSWKVKRDIKEVINIFNTEDM